MVILKPLVAVLATSALAVKLVQHLHRTRQQRHARTEQRQHRDDMHRWEGEGGNLPPRPQR